MGNETEYGTTCESPAYHLLTTSASSINLYSSADVNVCLWDLGEYQDHDTVFPSFIDPDWIRGQLAMTMVSIGQNKTKVWATIELAKVCILYMPSDLNTDLC